MTMPAGLLRYGQAGSYDAIDDRSVITALAGGRLGLVQSPTMAAGAGLTVNLGPWLALVAAGDGTTAVIGDRDSRAIPVPAGGAAARTETLWADIQPEAATWGPLQILGAAQLVGRAGLALGTIITPANANAASALTLTPSRTIAPLVSMVRVLTADEDRATNITWELSPTLQVPVEPFSSYSFTLSTSYRGGGGASAGHIRARFTRPAGALGRYVLHYRGTGMSPLWQEFAMGEDDNVRWGTDGVNNYYPTLYVGAFTTAAAGGTFGLAWGQGTSAGTICRLLPRTQLTVVKQ